MNERERERVAIERRFEIEIGRQLVQPAREEWVLPPAPADWNNAPPRRRTDVLGHPLHPGQLADIRATRMACDSCPPEVILCRHDATRTYYVHTDFGGDVDHIGSLSFCVALPDLEYKRGSHSVTKGLSDPSQSGWDYCVDLFLNGI